MRRREDQRVVPRIQFTAATSTSKSPQMSCRSRRVPTEQWIAKEGERTLSTLPRQAGLEASHGGGLGLEVTADVMPFGTQRDNGLHKNEIIAGRSAAMNAFDRCFMLSQTVTACDSDRRGI